MTRGRDAVIASVRAGAGRAAQAATWRWERVPIRVQGRITVALPLLAVVISAGLAIVGNGQRADIETDIQRRFEVNATLGALTTSMVDAETGVRGYLLTRDAAFLEPFDRAARDLPVSLDRLGELTAAEPGEVPRAEEQSRLADLRAVTAAQLRDLSYQRTVVSSGGDPAGPEIRSHLASGKQLMDTVRADAAGMTAVERERLDRRIADSDAVRVRDYVSVAVALVAALATRFLAWYLFRRGVLQRVDRLTHALRGRRRGDGTASAPPTKNDQMGELEREVHLLDR